MFVLIIRYHLVECVLNIIQKNIFVGVVASLCFSVHMRIKWKKKRESIWVCISDYVPISVETKMFFSPSILSREASNNSL